MTRFLDRLRTWLEMISGEPGRLLAITHPAFIRAAILLALDASLKSFWRSDIAPASLTLLHHREQN